MKKDNKLSKSSQSSEFGDKKRARTPRKGTFGKDQIPDKTSKKLYLGRGKDQKPIYEWTDAAAEKKKPAFKKPFSPIKSKAKFKPDEQKPEYSLKGLGSQHKNKDTDEIRLNKYIANAGICSRRDADKLIEGGEIKVNGQVITALGYKVQRGDKVLYNGRALNPEKPMYVLLNKPKDFITTTDDPFERKTVMQLVENACDERIFPVGRLDRNTTGLLLFTNDGELTESLAHPSNNIKKIYQVTLDKPLTKKDADIILEGIELEDGLTKVDDLQILSVDKTILGLEIHSGKNRIVRRIFAHFGYDVIALDRVTYAGLTKKDLPRGKYRFLTEKEVINLKYLRKNK
jgi:23S rRNA pseudouridine2605 synthase